MNNVTANDIRKSTLPLFTWGYILPNGNGCGGNFTVKDLPDYMFLLRRNQGSESAQAQADFPYQDNGAKYYIRIPEAEKLKEELSSAKAEIEALKAKLSELEAPIIAAAKAKADFENDLIGLFS
jgi:hypothetical protein